jgi:hypothetical protein
VVLVAVVLLPTVTFFVVLVALDVVLAIVDDVAVVVAFCVVVDVVLTTVEFVLATVAEVLSSAVLLFEQPMNDMHIVNDNKAINSFFIVFIL